MSKIIQYVHLYLSHTNNAHVVTATVSAISIYEEFRHSFASCFPLNTFTIKPVKTKKNNDSSLEKL